MQFRDLVGCLPANTDHSLRWVQ